MKHDLIDFALDCLKEIFPENYAQAKIYFEQNLDCYDDMGCLQGLDCIRHNIKRANDQMAEYRAKQSDSTN